MRIRAPLQEDVEVARNWRNRTPEMLRTSFLLTEQMQKDFYLDVICDRRSTSRFFSIVDIQGDLLAFIGIENIQWENRLGEISCIIKYGYETYMTEILNIVLDTAFNQLNLISVFTEVYECSPYFEEWERYAIDKLAYDSILPYRKFWDGRFYDSIIYTFVNPAYEKLCDGGDKMGINCANINGDIVEEVAEAVAEETTDLATETEVTETKTAEETEAVEESEATEPVEEV